MKIKSLLYVAAAAVMMLSCGEKKQETVETPKYELVTLKSESRTINTTFPAVLLALNEIELFPQVEGRILKLHFQNGDFVKKGQVLVTIDPTPYRLQVQSDEANLKAAEASLSSAKLQYESQQKLFEKKIVSEYVMKTAQNTYLAAQAQVAQAKAALSNSRTNLSRCTVVAPFSGVVKGKNDNIGTLVGPNMEQAILTLSDQSTVIAKFSIDENRFAMLWRTSDSITDANAKQYEYIKNVELKLKDGTMYDHKGELKNMDGIINSATGTITCEVYYKNPDMLLRSGGAATVIFPIKYNNVITLPQTACKKLQNKYLAFKVGAEGQAVGVLVDVQPTSDGKEFIVMDSSLKAGDEILVSGVDRVQEGQKIK